jgi:putative endonuclease
MFFLELWSAILAWWRGRPTPTDLGARGERLAETHYLRQGGRCLAMNWRHGRDELDLVMLEGEVLVFVEVKTRTAEIGGEGYWAVNRRKKRALRRAAAGWLRQIGGACHTRFDVVEVLVCKKGTVRLLQHRGEVLFGRRRF